MTERDGECARERDEREKETEREKVRFFSLHKAIT